MPPSKSVQSLHNLFNILQAHLTASDKTANVICSPFNIATCVSMLADGTAGTSREELINFFNFAGPDQQKISLQNELVKTFSAILPAAQQKTSSIAQMVKSAQGIFVTKDIQQSYIQKIQTDYRAIVKQINPAADIPGAVKDVNDFVSNSTEGKITELVQASDFSANTIMVLVAALFFKGKFATPFDKEKTANKEFHVAPGKIKEVPTMFGTQKNAKLIDAGGVITLAIPYAGSEVYLVLEMKKPAKKGEIYASLPEKSDAARIITCVSDKTVSREVDVFLPKFKARSTIKDVKDVFINKCGVKEIFNPKKNDLHPIVGGKPSDPSEVYVSSIIHQAMVEVDEEGTVAAAATSLMMCLQGLKAPAPVVTFDHPFYYHIVDKVNGSTLFSGSISDPTV